MGTLEPATRRFLYDKVVEDFAQMILAGTLLPGERLPSIRRCAERRGVSVTTVIEAYRRLEDLGLVQARPQSGFYVRATAGRRPPEPRKRALSPEPREVKVAALAAQVWEGAGSPDLLPLGAAVPSPELLPAHKLGRFLSAAVRAQPHASVDELKRAGSERLRRAIAQRAIESGTTGAVDDVIVCSGCMEALALSLRALTRPGDVVAVEAPTFYGVLQVIESLRLRAVEIAAAPRVGPDLERLEQVAATHAVKAIVAIPNGHNPLGYVMDDEQKRRLVEIAARFEIPLIEDDVYGELWFTPQRPRSLKSFDEEGWVLQCGSFSKTLAPSYRVGWIVTERFRDAVLDTKFASSYSAAGPSQLAIAAYLRGGGFDHHLRRLRRMLHQNLDRLCVQIARSCPAGTRVSRPDGGIVLWVEFPERLDSLELYRQARREGIGLAPGTIFSASGEFRNCIRLNGAILWSERIREAIDRLGELAGELVEAR